MSWMDFKTAQAMKAQKLSSASLRTNSGVQKGTGGAVHLGVDSMSVQKAIKAPKPSRRVQGVNKEARMTFAPGRGQRLASTKADTGTHRQTLVSAPDHIVNAPKPREPAVSSANASYGSGKTYDSSAAVTQQFAKMSVATPAAAPDTHAEEQYGEEQYAEETYYDEEGYGEEGQAEEYYAEEAYSEEANAEEAYYEEEGYYAEEGQAEGGQEAYAEEAYYAEEGYAEEGYAEEG